MSDSLANIAAGFTKAQNQAEAGRTDHSRRLLEDKAAAWIPATQTMHANYTRLKAEGHALSPSMHMALGYAEQAKAAHNKINGK